MADLPALYGPSAGVEPFYAGALGVWTDPARCAEAEAAGEIAGTTLLDATISRPSARRRRPPRRAIVGGAQARERGPQPGCFSTKLYLREGNGRPLTAVLTAVSGRAISLEALLSRRDPTPRSGPRRLRPLHVARDKGYSSPTDGAALRRRHIVCYPTKHHRRQPTSNRPLRRRNRVERLINRLQQFFPRIATRYENARQLPAMFTSSCSYCGSSLCRHALVDSAMAVWSIWGADHAFSRSPPSRGRFSQHQQRPPGQRLLLAASPLES